MSLSAGTRLGPFEIAAQIGVGGMGEVYRATDTNLKRQVAIKVLPASMASDVDRLTRFQREAEVLASLNHPNIAQIHGLEKSAGTTALVMELVEGPTLADQIARGPIPLDEALPIASQIAEALEAAHEQRIIHRDLKPGNIKVRPDGTVKVLDFGLAKAMDPNAAMSPSVTQSPTITTPAMTQFGVILGTAAYMSPEQARGTPVDRRADVWAFGCVFYEMLTGRRAFAGETIAETIAKTLERDPDWHALPASTPPRLRELLRRCLQKDQHHRLHDIADARIEIEDAKTAKGQPQRLVRTRLTVVATTMVVLALMAGAARYGWRSASPAAPEAAGAEHEPVSVLIADFQNDTGDPVFDRTLEPVLRLVLEGARFISAYDGSTAARTFGVSVPESLDEKASREIAIKQGLGVVVSGAVGRWGSGYRVSARATQSVSGEIIASDEEDAADKQQVLAAATELATRIRSALGDETSESGRRFAADALSASSLEVVHDYALAMDALSRSRFADALDAFSRAVASDPNFGMAFAGMAISARNLDRQQDAEKYIREAVRHVDGMTERERYRTRGLFFYLTNDYQRCVTEYEALVARYAADVSARNNLALCLTHLRQMPRALDEMRRVVDILPNRALYRVNLSLYATYSGAFDAGEREARTVQDQSPWGIQALALALTGHGQVPQAIAAYRRLANVGQLGSYGTSGLGDLAAYEGRWAEAARIYREGAAVDLTNNDPDRAAAKFAALGHIELRRRQESAAVAAVDRALALSQTVKIRFLTGRLLVEAGRAQQASELATGLAAQLQSEPQAYGKILAGEIALRNGDARQAIKTLAEANGILDTWIGHFDLGRAYLEASAFVQADSEFDRCIERRGEALSLFLDEEPTAAYLPPAYYYQGLAREGLKAEGWDTAYRRYLEIRGRSTEDPLVREVKRRMDRDSTR